MKSVKLLLMLVGAVILGGVLWDWLGPKPGVATAPLVPSRAQTATAQSKPITTEAILRWGLDDAPMSIAYMGTDALPNGLALAMLSILVDWEQSALEGEDSHVLLRHVRVGGNPVTGRNVLGTVRVPLNGIEEVQWCLTPNRTADGRDTVSMGHAMLRFLFAHEDRATVQGLGGVGDASGIDPYIDDILLSWEAWRPPKAPYDPVASLDPETYSLTVRGYTGAQRFLDDAVRGNPWKCYPLALPRTPDANRAVFLIAAAMGDALLRRVLHTMQEQGTLDQRTIERMVADLDEAELDRMRALLAPNEVTDDPMSALLGQTDLSYQLLERSCITQSLTAVQWALERIHRKHDLGPAPTLAIVPDGLPPWMNDLAHASPNEMVAHLPSALWFVARNQSVLPGNAWRILADAGLLQQDGKGGVQTYYYDPRDQTPYGEIDINLM